MKLIIPLLSKELTKEDVSQEAGFVDAYSYDKNRPSIENCIFLMYDTRVKTSQFGLTEYKLSNLPELRSKKVCTIDNKQYLVYAIVVLDTDIKNLLKGLRHTKTSSYTRFVQFWGTTDGMVNRYIVCPTEAFAYGQTSVPEEDCAPTIVDLRRKARVPGLVLEPSFLYCFYESKISL